MNEALMLWVGAAGVVLVLLALAVVALRRTRREAERRRHAEAAALELARQEVTRAAAQRTAARQAAAADAAARQQAELAEQARQAARRADERLAAERVAEAEAQARAQAARLENERLAAERAAHQENEARARLEAEQQARRQAERAASPVAAPPSAPPQDTRSAGQPLVLVADDSKVVRVKISRLLAQQGYRVALAEDGRQAAQLIDQEVPLVLITDVEMPLMDGFELTRHVRAHIQARHIPIIMITSADDRLKAEAAAAGVTLVLGKPYAEDALLACIARAMAAEGQPT